MAGLAAFSSSSSSSFTTSLIRSLVLFVSAALLFDSGEAGAAHRVVDPVWHPATATWYGSADGDGSDGGACGYGTLVDVVPMKARVGAVSPVLFKDGEGCGACYKVRCLDAGICSRRAVTVIVTDECPGGVCAFGRTHFDLSGAAFGRLAVAGHGGQLRNRGEISVVFRRTACKYGGKNIAFHVNEGSTSFWLSLLVEFEDGDGDIGSMQLKQVGSCCELGAVAGYEAHLGCHVEPDTGASGGALLREADNPDHQADALGPGRHPKNWTPKATYTSRLNFS
ncbi:hypothetical protein GUJ93_ZPchr0024g29087 [Zizania palustris]|uniref:Expansin-like EG45 domain-containing protein n=1 Tax=Zizania palustris TaxID=103762 RepID=A0A8J5REF3_ZIZPA|nr:hypothetical protein GUJ93_ZPchr0024g29087 [Zizania palustris]